MSKIKKVLAMLLTLALVLGMGITTFAAPGDANSKVTVKNADKATLTIAQVIETDNTAVTGWKFTDGAARHTEPHLEARQMGTMIRELLPA